MSLPDRTPQNVELEMAVLGAILLEPEHAPPIVRQILHPSDYYLDGHALLYSLMLELWDGGTTPDSIAVLDALRNRDLLDKVGGGGVVMGLLTSVPSAANLVSHARIVKAHSLRRQAIRACSTITDAAQAGEHTPAQLSALLEQAAGLLRDEGIAPTDQLAADALLDYYRDEQAGISYTTGFERLDDMMSGWTRKRTHILAARANIGKSLATSYSLACAHQAGAGIGIMSLDMGNEFLKYLATSTLNTRGYTVSWRRVDREVVAQASDALREAPPIRFVTERQNVAGVQRLMRKWRKDGVGICMIDQAQNIREYSDALRRNPPNRELISWLIQEAKDAAKDCDMALILLHQINRAGAERPTLADLKDCGGFEERADRVVLLHDPQVSTLAVHGSYGVNEQGVVVPPKARRPSYSEATNPRPLVLDLAKNRGPKGAFAVEFNFDHGVVAYAARGYQGGTQT